LRKRPLKSNRPPQESPILTPAYLDLQDLAQYSSCSVRWLRSRLTDQTAPLPHYRIRGKILVKVAEFDQWMKNYRLSAPPGDLEDIVDDVVSKIYPAKTA